MESTMETTISTDLLAIITLCFTIWLANRNIVINNHKNRIYISAAATTIIILVLEIATILMGQSSRPSLVIPHRIANITGFALSPAVPLMILFLNKTSKTSILLHAVISIPLFFNAFMCIASYKTGWIFFVDAHNQYTRGDWFLIPALISAFYFASMIVALIRNRVDFDLEDKQTLLPILLIPILGTAVQVLFPNVVCLWASISVSLLLYYIFLRELQFKYDPQTNIKNRAAFEKEMKQYLKNEKSAGIVVFDVNDLKMTNDRYGHEAGDKELIDAASIIKDSFIDLGEAFRIGGDEFCVICPEISRETLEDVLLKLDRSVSALNKERGRQISLAYGYAFFNNNLGESIYTTFAEADRSMYMHKSQLKSGSS